jgi:hypothetical protein
MDYNKRVELFKNELELISNPAIKDFIKACLKEVPDYIFTDCPSSSSGKYHPIEELSADGTIIHTKKVFAVAYELSRALDCEHHRDEICAAAILHDMLKQGKVKSGHTVKDHPQLMAQFVADLYKNKFKEEGKLSRESMIIIYYGIFYHYGPWTEKSVAKDMSKYSKEELAVYLADYIVSKRFVHIDIKRR